MSHLSQKTCCTGYISPVCVLCVFWDTFHCFCATVDHSRTCLYQSTSRTVLPLVPTHLYVFWDIFRYVLCNRMHSAVTMCACAPTRQFSRFSTHTSGPVGFGTCPRIMARGAGVGSAHPDSPCNSPFSLSQKPDTFCGCGLCPPRIPL